MTPEEHKARHKELHESLDELVADYLSHHREAMPSNTTIMDLIRWSAEQTRQPSEKDPAVHVVAVCGHCGKTITESEIRHICESDQHDLGTI